VRVAVALWCRALARAPGPQVWGLWVALPSAERDSSETGKRGGGSGRKLLRHRSGKNRGFWAFSAELGANSCAIGRIPSLPGTGWEFRELVPFQSPEISNSNAERLMPLLTSAGPGRVSAGACVS
jgi:hypothetical protein